MACGYKAAARDVPGVILLLLLFLVVVASLATVTRCAWVGDYASDHGCEKTFVEALCDPADAGKNRACSDACHYNGCGGGRCVYVGAARGCYCMQALAVDDSTLLLRFS